MDTFAPEREHSLVLQAATPCKNTRAFERSVLSLALALHGARLDTLARDGLIQARPMGDDFVSLQMRWHGNLVMEGDVLFVNDGVFYVEGCMQKGNRLALCGRPCKFLEQVA